MTCGCVPPSARSATSSLYTSRAESEPSWRSRTHTTQRPFGVSRPSAYRHACAVGGGAVTGSGCGLPASRRYIRWSAKFVVNTVSPRTHHAPPPYSCTRVRALIPSGRRSRGTPPGSRRTICSRPPSAGLVSLHQVTPPSAQICVGRDPAVTTCSAPTGEGHVPYGRVGGTTRTLSCLRRPSGARSWDAVRQRRPGCPRVRP
jgi:hypothetical protein